MTKSRIQIGVKFLLLIVWLVLFFLCDSIVLSSELRFQRHGTNDYHYPKRRYRRCSRAALPKLSSNGSICVGGFRNIFRLESNCRPRRWFQSCCCMLHLRNDMFALVPFHFSSVLQPRRVDYRGVPVGILCFSPRICGRNCLYPCRFSGSGFSARTLPTGKHTKIATRHGTQYTGFTRIATILFFKCIGCAPNYSKWIH